MTHKHRKDLFIVKTKRGWKIVKDLEKEMKKKKPAGAEPMPCMCQFNKRDQKTIKGLGLVLAEDALVQAEDAYDSNEDDNEPSAGGLFNTLKKKGKNLVSHVKEKFEKGKKFVEHVIHGRYDEYPPKAKKVLEANQDAKIEHVELHRKALSQVIYQIINTWTGGEVEKRLQTEPKDKLFHISMWVKLSNGKTIKVEKNAVVNLEENPTKHKEEQVLSISTPDTTFGDFLEKTRKKVGDNDFFLYNAKHNNCGNFIEFILDANGISSQATHDFIGQNVNKILDGFPSLRKAMNTVTDIGGKADVIMQGGEIKSHDKVMISRNVHPSQLSERFFRTPQSFNQIHARVQVPCGSGLYAGHGLYAGGFFDDLGRATEVVGRAAGRAAGRATEQAIAAGRATEQAIAGIDKTGGQRLKERMDRIGDKKIEIDRHMTPKLVGAGMDSDSEEEEEKMKGGRLKKGSAAAKAHMARIRKMKGGRIPAPPSRSYVTDSSLLG